MSDNIARQILDIAELAQAPPRDFKPWTMTRFAQVQWVSNTPVTVLSYLVPRGLSLVVTNVTSWVSEDYDPATSPGIPKPVQPVINSQGFNAYWLNDNKLVIGQDSFYTVLGQGEQLVVFPSKTTAQFVMRYFGPPLASIEQSFQFRFFGFLTLSEHAERLIKNQTLTP